MSVAESASNASIRANTSLLELSGARSLRRLPIYAACTAAALLLSYLLGKEMGWDMLNYHLYAGFSAVHDRFAQDYFAAGSQSYLNPYVYVPFYALATSHLSALQASLLLAALHSIVLWLTFELAIVTCLGGTPTERVVVGALAALFALANPVLIQQIGTSFSDITTTELVLAGWVLLASVVRSPSIARLTCAAVLLGAASALKLTNALHAASSLVILFLLPMPPRAKIRYGAYFSTALAVSFAIICAPWSYRLAGRFGNPFFPMLNGLFRSPEFTTEPLRHLRFVPSSLAEAALRPFAMLDPQPMVHEELSAPDVRYAVLVALLGVLLLQRLWRRMHREAVQLPQESGDTRVLKAIGCAFAVDWLLWLIGSGNSRYFLPMACVAGVLGIALLFRLCGTRYKVRHYALVTIFATQAVQLWMGAEFRWNGASWDGGAWFEVDVPPLLKTEPSLYLTMGTESDSFIAPYLARGSGLVNFTGGYALGSTRASARPLQALIHQYAPHLRFLARGARLYANAERREPSVAHVDAALARIGLRADPSDCVTITVHGLPPDPEVTVKGASVEKLPAGTTDLVSCRVVKDADAQVAASTRQRTVDVVLDRLEDACPSLFQPRRMPTDNYAGLWRRIYPNTDLVAWVNQGRVRFQDPTRGDEAVTLGRESDWLQAPLRLECGRRHAHYFAHVLGASEADAPPP
jgi:hypothetical protein